MVWYVMSLSMLYCIHLTLLEYMIVNFSTKIDNSVVYAIVSFYIFDHAGWLCVWNSKYLTNAMVEAFSINMCKKLTYWRKNFIIYE